MPARPPPSATMERHQLIVRIVEPPSGPARATVVLLHAEGGRLDDLVSFARALGRDLRLVAAQGPRGVYQGPALVSHSWYGGERPEAPDPPSFLDALRQVELLVDEVRNRFEGAPIVLGHRQGGVLGLAVALVMPDLISAAIAIAARPAAVPSWEVPARDAAGLPVLLVGGADVAEAAEALRATGAIVSVELVEGDEVGPSAQAAVRGWLAVRRGRYEDESRGRDDAQHQVSPSAKLRERR